MISQYPQHSEPNSNHPDNQANSGIDLYGPHPHAPWPPGIDPALFNFGSQAGTSHGNQQNTGMQNPGGAEQRRSSISPHNNSSHVNNTTDQSDFPQRTPPSRSSNAGQDVHGGEVTREQSPLPTTFGPVYPGAYPAPTDEVLEANEQKKKQQAYHQAQAKRMRESISGRTPIIDPTLKILNQAQQMASAGNYTQQGQRGQPSNGVSRQCGTNVAFTDPHLAQQEIGFPPHTQRVVPTYQNVNYNGQNHGAATKFGSGGLYGPHIDSLLGRLPHGGQGVGLTREQQEQLLNLKRAASNRNTQLGLVGMQSSQHQQAHSNSFQAQNSPLTSAQILELQQQKARLQSQNNGFPQMFANQEQQYGPSQAASKPSPGKAKRKRSPSKAAANVTPTAPSSTAPTNHTPAVQNSASPALNVSSPAMNRRLSSAQRVSVPINPNMVHSLSQGGPINVKGVFGRIILQPDQELYVEREGKVAKLKEVLKAHPELHVAILGSRVGELNGQHTPQTISTQQGLRPVSTTPQAAPQQFQNGPAKQTASYSEQFIQKLAEQSRKINVKQAVELALKQAQIASQPAIQKQAWAQMQGQIASQPPIQRVQAASHDLSSVISGSPQYMPRNPLTSLPQAAYGLIAQTPSQPSTSFLMPSPGLLSPQTPQQGSSTPQGSHAAATSPQRLQHAQLDGRAFSPPLPQDPQQIQRSTKRPREETSENAEQPAKRLKAPNTVENNAMVSEAPVMENTSTGGNANIHASLPQGGAATDGLPEVPKSVQDFTSGLVFEENDNGENPSWWDEFNLPDVDFDSQNWATSPTGDTALPTEESNTGNSTEVEQAPSPKTHTTETKDQGASVVQGASADEGALVHQGTSDAPQMTAEEHSTTVAGGDSADYEDQEVLGSEMDNGGEGIQLEDEDDPIRKVFEDFMREHPQCSMDDHFPGVWGEDVESREDSDFGTPTAPEDRASSPEVALQQINVRTFPLVPFLNSYS